LYVCLGRAITDRAVVSAVQEGACSFRDVAGRCGAGTICGGCRPAILALLGELKSTSSGGVAVEGERQALKVLADGIKVSLDEGDDASREFFAGSLLDEEEHADWLETELSLIGQVGEANYLAQQIHD
jgi:bacterioferritin-associated ferredoxin